MILVAMMLAVQQAPGQAFPPVDHPGADPLIVADLRSACPSSIATDRVALLKLEEHQADLKVLAADASAWFALACTRALLGVDGAISRQSTMMIAGDSWMHGALNALVKELSLRPGDRRGADLLAMLAMNEPEVRDAADLAMALDKAVGAGAVGNATLRGCAEFGIQSGHPEITRRCSEQALRAGKDSTWHSLLLARLAFRAADSGRGVQAFVQAAGAAHDTLAKLAIAWHLQWFVTPEERQAWASLGDSARGAWVRNLLATRDVRDARPVNSRLAEHFKRLEHADSAFRLSVARLLRTAMLTKPSAGIGAPASSPVPMTAGLAQDVSDQASMLMNQSFRDYMRWQIDLDDRGVTWLRFGEPLKRHFAPDTEVWYYEIDGKPLVLTFVYEMYSGSAAPSRLISGRIGDVYCGIDTWRCLLGMRQQLNPELIAEVRQQDREFIRAATTEDDNSIRTEKTIEVTSRLHRLWDPVSGAPIALLTYAVKAGDLVTPRDSAERTARVEFELRRWDATENRWQDTAFSRRFTFADKGVQRLTGFLLTPSSPTVSSWSLVATQAPNRRGRAWDVSTGPLDTGPLALSDLVLGQEGQGISWVNHNVAIPLAPLNAVDRLKSVSIYYQIRSDAVRPGIRSTVALYRVENGVARDTAALQVEFDQAVRAGVNEVAPTLDVSRLDKGSYRLEVRLSDASGTVITRRGVELKLE